MNPTQHPSNNKVIAAPKGWDQSELECTPLALTVSACPKSGCTLLQSIWTPTPAEIERILGGRPVVLTVYGTVHPVVSVGVEYKAGDPIDPA